MWRPSRSEMWARRLGVPHLWPSRVKVFFLGILTSVVIFSVFQYLHGANVEYLDLAHPVSNDIVCTIPRRECAENEDPVRCTLQLEEWTPQSLLWGLNLSSPCPALPKTIGDSTCTNPTLPLTSITGDLGTLRTVSGVNPFKLWSLLFLVLTSLLSLSIVIHDLALLNEHLRPLILSVPNLKYARPCLWEWLSCLQCRRRMQRLRRRNRCLWTFLVPVWMFFQVLAFMVVLYPAAFLVYMVAPVRMSRIMVFLSAILCMLWSIIFVIETALDTQPYAVLWGAKEPEFNTNCICHCQFFLSRSVILRVVVLGAGVCWNSFNLTFRALRGLRRAQWANMFSVLYAVPIEAFPVFWDRPADAGGGPIRHRREGEAIQSEPAFDPFCLMDEQPESAWTRVQVMPVAWTEQQQFVWERFSGSLDTEIGCCGFPRPVQYLEMDDGEGELRDDVPEEDPVPKLGSPADASVTATRRAMARPPWLSELQEGESFSASRFDPNIAVEGRASSQCSSPLSWGAWGGSRPASANGTSAGKHMRNTDSILNQGRDGIPSIPLGQDAGGTPPSVAGASGIAPPPALIGRSAACGSETEATCMPSIDGPPSPNVAGSVSSGSPEVVAHNTHFGSLDERGERQAPKASFCAEPELVDSGSNWQTAESPPPRQSSSPPPSPSSLMSATPAPNASEAAAVEDAGPQAP